MLSYLSSFNLIYFLIFTILLTSPLPYGSVTSGGKLLLLIQSYLVLLVYSIHLYKHKKPFPDFNDKYQQWALSIFLIICIFQIIPLPWFLLDLISNSSYQIWNLSQESLSEIGLGSKRYFYTISIDPHKTWMEIIVLLSYISIAYVVSRTFITDFRLRIILLPIFIISIFEASYGIYQYLSDPGVTDVIDKNIATGTFINRNNYAGLLEMTIPLILAYTLSLYTWNENKSTIKNIISSDNFSKQFSLLFILGLMLLALMFSLSRMGIMVAFLSLIFFWVIHSSITKKRKSNMWILLFIVGIVALYSLAIGIYPIFERFIEIKDNAPARVIVWKDMLSAVWDFPIFGSGLGTFIYIYMLYNKSTESPVEYNYAHNDYLQLFIETGLPATLLILSALFLFLRSSYRNINNLYLSGEIFRFYIGIGAMTGVVAILIHSLVDFNLHIPSNAAYFAILMGILAAIGKQEETNKPNYQENFDQILETNLTKRKRRKKLRSKSTLEE